MIDLDQMMELSSVVRCRKSWARLVEAIRLDSHLWYGVWRSLSVISQSTLSSSSPSRSFFRFSSFFRRFFLSFSSSPRGDLKYLWSTICPTWSIAQANCLTVVLKLSVSDLFEPVDLVLETQPRTPSVSGTRRFLPTH